MKKAGLVAIIFACFTFMFAAPSVNANRNDSTVVTPGSTTTVMPNRYNTGNTLTQDMERGYVNMKNDVNRAATNVENGVNRAANNVGTGMNRAMNQVGTDVNRVTKGAETGVSRTLGVRDYDAYNTNAERNATMNRYNYRATANTTAANRGFSWGWLGLLGLFGLAGMRSRDRA